MIRLLTAELHRLGARWIAQAAVVVGLLVVVTAGLVEGYGMRPPGAAELAQNRANYQTAVAEWKLSGAQAVKDCEAASRTAVNSGQPPIDCTDLAPRPEQYSAAPQLVSSLTAETPFGVALVTGLLAVIVATSLVGTEFSSGSMSAWLLVEPRRTRVYVAKLTAAALYAEALALLGAALMMVAWWIVGAVDHLRFDLTVHDEVVLAARTGRMLLVVPAVALAASGIAFLVRSTAGAFLAVVAWVVGTTYVLQGRHAEWASIGHNLAAWIDGRVTYYWTTCGTDAGCVDHSAVITTQQGGLVLFGLSALAVLAGWLAFRRRDIP